MDSLVPTGADRRVTHGETTQAFEAGPFIVTEASYTGGLRVPRHEHARPSWTYVRAGAFEERFDRQAEYCTPGSLLMKPADADHANVYSPIGAHCVLIEMRSSYAKQYPSLSQDVRFDGDVSAAVRTQLGRLVAPHSAPLEREVILFELCAALGAQVAGVTSALRERGWLQRVRDRLGAEFVSPPTITALAAEAEVNPVYLCHAFRSVFGQSPGEFVRRRQLEFARYLLLSSATSLSMVALSAGFCDQSHFSRRFRAITGETPARFRARHRRGTAMPSNEAEE